MEFLEVFLHESKANLTIPASDLNIYCLELHYIHIALLFSPHIQMFYLNKNVFAGSLEKERVIRSTNCFSLHIIQYTNSQLGKYIC